MNHFRLLLFKLCFATAGGLLFWWLLADEGHKQQAVGASFATTIILWLSHAFPLGISSLIGVVLLTLLGGAPEKSAFASFGDPIMLLFVGSFMLAKAVTESGLGIRLAHIILSQEWATGTPPRMLLSVGLVACTLSLLVSNTAVTAMMLPIGIALLHATQQDSTNSRFGIGLMLMLTWGSSVAVGFLVGTPPNMIGRDLIQQSTGKTIGFIEWMVFAMPITIMMIFAAWLVLWFRYGRTGPKNYKVAHKAREQLFVLGPIKCAERNTLIILIIAFTLWMLPDLSTITLGHESTLSVWLADHLSPTIAALIAASLLFLLPCSDTESGYTLSWRQAVSIDWGVILLIGGGMALGTAMFESGLAQTAGEALVNSLGATSLWQIVGICTAFAILMSEIASNTASAATTVPVSIALSEAAGVNPIPAALGAAIGASFGFMMPVSTPPNAIVFSSGRVPQWEMVKSGVMIDAIGWAVTMLLLWLLLPAIGLV